MLRRFLAIAVMLSLLLPLSPEWCAALPPNPETEKWNEEAAPIRMVGESDADFKARRDAWIKKKIKRLIWNCYNYGVDVQSTDAAGDPVRAHPGKGMAWPNLGNAITAANMCTKARDRAVADGLKAIAWTVGDPIPTPPAGENLVALGGLAGDKGDGADYHWWRLNGDGSWSHKRGGTDAKATYTDGTGAEQALTDPREVAQRDGYDLCGFMTVKKATPPNVGSLAAAPVCNPREGTVLVQVVGPSGLPDPQRVLTSSEVSQLMTFLPPFTPSNQTSNPNWGHEPAGVLAGFIVVAGVDGFGPIPPYMRVYLGRVEAVQAWPNEQGDLYYNDTQGLESFLAQTVLNQQTVPCPDGSTDQPLSPCQCSDEAQGDQPTATLLSLFQAVAVPAGLELRWQFGDPLRFVSVELERADDARGPWSRPAVERREESGIVIALDRGVIAGRPYHYRLSATTREGEVLRFGPLAGTAGARIDDFTLAPVAPNPSFGPTRLEFSLPREAHIRLAVMDLQGREVALLAQGAYRPGRYQVTWNARTAHGEAPAGRYFVRLQTPEKTLVRPLVLAR
ncbi:MAG TPA: hypothetical protein VEY91_13635 [Candidatus Limnocylindria bacterium]|nr:hypothetical protein [Candidatus Limnocylindria bacterium]